MTLRSSPISPIQAELLLMYPPQISIAGKKSFAVPGVYDRVLAGIDTEAGGHGGQGLDLLDR
jgi:hypothetical protein